MLNLKLNIKGRTYAKDVWEGDLVLVPAGLGLLKAVWVTNVEMFMATMVFARFTLVGNPIVNNVINSQNLAICDANGHMYPNPLVLQQAVKSLRK